jgi:hypothetical protein
MMHHVIFKNIIAFKMFLSHACSKSKVYDNLVRREDT